MTEKDVGKNIVENFKFLLIKNKKSISEIAQKTGTSSRGINNFLERLEEGKGGSLKTICKYANALGVSPYVLFYENKLVPRESNKKGSD